jgi:hypothetical protein
VKKVKISQLLKKILYFRMAEKGAEDDVSIFHTGYRKSMKKLKFWKYCKVINK